MKMMKKNIYEGFALAFLCALTLSFSSCANNSGDSSSADPSPAVPTYAELPESVGINPFIGKTWKENIYDLQEKWIFGENTVKHQWVLDEYDDEDETIVIPSTSYELYNYTYNTDKGLLYLGLIEKSEKGKDGDRVWHNADEYINLFRDELSWPQREYARIASDFATKHVYEYNLSGACLKLQEYFDGTLPTQVFFSYQKGDEDEDESYFGITLQLGGMGVSYGDEEGNICDYALYPVWSGNSFTGPLYQSFRPSDLPEDEESIRTILGNASGTFSVNGLGVKDSKITITFTSLPEEAAGHIPLNTPFELEQYIFSGSDDVLLESLEDPVVNLPSSSGENSFEGTEWNILDESLVVKSLKFTADTLTETDYNISGGTSEFASSTTYRYTFNSHDKRLYLAKTCISFNDKTKTYTWNTLEDVKNDAEAKAQTDPVPRTEAVVDSYVESERAARSIVYIYDYEVSGESLILTPRYDGKLSTAASFTCTNPNSGKGVTSLTLKNGVLEMHIIDEDTGETIVYCYPVYEEGGAQSFFSSAVYFVDLGDEEPFLDFAGILTGTCTVESGAGDSWTLSMYPSASALWVGKAFGTGPLTFKMDEGAAVSWTKKASE